MRSLIFTLFLYRKPLFFPKFNANLIRKLPLLDVVYMGHLRQKLEDDPAQPQYLLTETAVGYRLVQHI